MTISILLLLVLCIILIIDVVTSFGVGRGIHIISSSPSFLIGEVGSALKHHHHHQYALYQNHRSHAGRTSRTSSSSSRMKLFMLKEPCGRDALEEMASSRAAPVVQTAIRKTPSKLRKIAGSVTLPAVAVAGFVLTPGPSLVVHSVGAALSTLVGGIGKSRLSVESLRAVQPALAQLLLDQYPDWITNPSATSTLVQQLQKDYQVTDPVEFMEIGMNIYRNYLVAMVKQPNAKTSDMAELTSLKQVLGLDNIAIGEAHAQAAQQVYRETMTFTPEEELQDPQHPDRMSMDKLLFLSERAFRSSGSATTSYSSSTSSSTTAATTTTATTTKNTTNNTDGAFIYEFSRVCKALKLPSINVGLQRVQSVAQPFYERALSSTRTKLETGAVNPEMLARARATIGISDTLANDLHLSAFAQEVRSLLGRTTTSTSTSTSTATASTDDDDEEDDVDGGNKETETAADAAASAVIQFPPGALERLEKLRQVLNISEKDAQYEISVEACPLFQKTVQDILQKEVLVSSDVDDETNHYASWWQRIATRQKELCIHQDNMIPLLDSIFTQTLGAPLEEASAFASVNNEAAVYTKLLEALSIKAKVSALLEQSNGILSATKYFDTDSMGSCFQFLSSEMRKKLYSLFLSRSVRGGGTSSSSSSSSSTQEDDTAIEDTSLAHIQELLGISDETAMDVSAIVCGPICQKALKESADEITAGDDVTPELIHQLKERNARLIQSYRIPTDLIHKYQCEIYKNYLRFVHQNSPSGIPSAMFAERLSHLQQLFDTMDSTQDIIPMHVATFGPSYKKSVLEAMGITGVINPEYREPLEKLRDRLGVGEEEAHKLFLSAISEKLVPMVQRIEYELERQFLTKEQVARKRGKDIGEDILQGGSRGDLGIGTQGNIMNDIVNLVDFYTENGVPVKIPKKQEGGADITLEAAAAATSDNATATATEQEMEVTYPVTAIGLKAVEPEMAEAMYHQFLVGSFTSSQQQQVARYEAAAPVFGGILGLPKERMEAVGGNVGSSVYENFISNVLQTKTSLDQQDMMFLAQIQSKLKMPPEKAEEMLIEAEKKVLKGRAQRLFDAPTILPSDIQGFRERCNGMGMDIQADLGISKERVAALFVMEITDGIERGSITTDSGDYLTELQESLGLTQEECEQAVLGLVQKRVPEYLDKIDKELLRGREDQCIDPIKKLIRFASFVGGEVDVEVRKDRAYKIVSMFEAADFGEETPDVLEAQKQVLKTALGLEGST